MKTDSALRRRLSGYWKMEGACALAFPVLALVLVRPETGPEWGVLVVALLACCSLLVLGTLYWRASLQLICRRPGPMKLTLAIADRLQWPLLILSLVSAGLAIFQLAARGPSPAAVTAAAFALLATLEYVNYFHIQLQNFDHLPDFKRLMRELRFPRSHLAWDLADYRRKRSATVAL